MNSNFEFVPGDWGETRADAVLAETYGRTDPRSCVFYARRVVEQVVVRIFDLERLVVPYRSDLAARIGDSGFRAAGMNLDNFVVRPEREWVQKYADWEPWTHPVLAGGRRCRGARGGSALGSPRRR